MKQMFSVLNVVAVFPVFYFLINNFFTRGVIQFGKNMIVDSFFKIPYANSSLHPFARSTLDQPNAGGPSEISEAYAIHSIIELLSIYGIHIQMCVSESNIRYMSNQGSMLDALLKVVNRFGKKSYIAVSITRAYLVDWANRTFDDKAADILLGKKLRGLRKASDRCKKKCRYKILYICCQSYRCVKIINRIMNNNYRELYPDTYLFLDICIGSNADPIFTNKV